MLIDGNSIMNRAFYGVGSRARLTSPEGVPTGAIMAFLNMLLQYKNQYNPTHLLVAFDRPEPTFRHLKYAEYKGKRTPMPDDLVIQMTWIKKILDEMRTARVELAGFEADDLIGTFAKMGAEAGMKVIVVSGDKDNLQLIDDRVHVLLPVTRGGVTSQDEYDRDLFFERYGITPEQFVDVKALMGDPSDNIPGVKGIGEKTALNLIARYGSIDGIYEHIDELKGTQRQRLIDGEKEAIASRHLSEIDCDVDVSSLDVHSLDLTSVKDPDTKLKSTLMTLGLRQLLQRFGLAETETEVSLTLEPMLDSFLDFAAAFDQARPVALLFEADTFFLAQTKTGAVAVDRGSFDAWQKEHQDTPLIVWDYKSMLHELAPFECARLPFDAFIAQALIEPSSSQAPDLRQTYGRYFDSPLPESKDREESRLLQLHALLALYEPLKARLEADQLETVFYQIEMPLAPVLSRMERRGIKIDVERLQTLAADMEKDIAVLETEIFSEAGGEFNLNSPKQLSEVLFVKMGLPPGKKNPSGTYSTAQEELDRLEPDFPIVGKIKEHRLLTKLNQTFLQGLAKEIAADGRIHTTYTQVHTATGRLSSVKPNLQNIPIRSARGRAIRDVFIAEDGYLLLDADYAQIELRILAHLADDEKLKAAFAAAEDIHAVTASNLFLVPVDKVNAEQRGIAKTVNFSIVYGVGDFGLAKSLHSSVAEARDYIDAYNRLYKGVRAYLDGQIKKAYDQGYVTTICGRRRYMHELKSPNRNIRNFGERAAMNAPVQGTAADLIKLAMIRVENLLREKNLDARLLLQVHDELIVESSVEDAPAAALALQEAMEGAMDLTVKLEAEVSSGPSWGETK